ncbi:MAG: hypothetical protein NVSMB17_06150 [Candidatus Dormibacteria bacterium]
MGAWPGNPLLVRRIATVGVYGKTGDEFIKKLLSRDVALVLDVRQRRGVRGPEYAWANSQRLQAALGSAGIAYRHHPELAPTTELRHLQYAEDDRQGVGKRSRLELASEYRERYQREILAAVDLGAFIEQLPDDATSALLCVEQYAQACHRSLIADRLQQAHGLPVTYL